MMTLNEFIDATEPTKMQNILRNTFVASISNEIPLYLDDTLLKTGGSVSVKAREHFLEKVYKYEAGVDYISLSNSEYKRFLTDPEFPARSTFSADLDLSKLYPEHVSSRANNNIKHIFIWPVVYKMILMGCNTKEALETKLYYIALESIWKKYITYSNNYRVEEQRIIAEASRRAEEEQRKIAKEMAKAFEAERALRITYKIHIFDRIERTVDGQIYIVSTRQQARNHIFKIGRTTNIKGRMCQYNTGRSEDDLMQLYKIYDVHNPVAAEYMIKHVLEKHRSSSDKEMYMMDFETLVERINSILHSYQHEQEQADNITKNYELPDPTSEPPTAINYDDKPEKPVTTVSKIYSQAYKNVALSVELSEPEVEEVVMKLINDMQAQVVKWSETITKIKAELKPKSKITKFKAIPWKALFVEELEKINKMFAGKGK